MPWTCFFLFFFLCQLTKRREPNIRGIFNENEKQRHNDNLIFFVTSSDCTLYWTQTIQSFPLAEWHIRGTNEENEWFEMNGDDAIEINETRTMWKKWEYEEKLVGSEREREDGKKTLTMCRKTGDE